MPITEGPPWDAGESHEESENCSSSRCSLFPLTFGQQAARAPPIR